MSRSDPLLSAGIPHHPDSAGAAPRQLDGTIRPSRRRRSGTLRTVPLEDVRDTVGVLICGTALQWRASRQMIFDGIDRDGTFLDLGCANGLLMESVHRWAAERGLHVEPYGVALGPRLVAAAQARLPHWADRIAVGNAIDYVPADRRRFTLVHVLVDLVPANRLAELLHHVLNTLIEPGGRLLASRYAPAGGTDSATAGDVAQRSGFPVSGESRAGTATETASTAWITQQVT